MNVPTRFRQPRKGFIAPLFVAGLVAFCVTSAKALPEDDVRATFDQFVTAQNAHDAAAVRELLLDSPSFLWVTRGAPIWGRDAALKRFEALYQGTWKLSPDTANLKAVMVNDMTAQIHGPITFNIGPPGPAGARCTLPDESDAGEDRCGLAHREHSADTVAAAGCGATEVRRCILILVRCRSGAASDGYLAPRLQGWSSATGRVPVLPMRTW